jgi:hypothetical protein
MKGNDAGASTGASSPEVPIDAAAHADIRLQGKVETCDSGHTFLYLDDHPRKDGLRRCPYCMAIGLDEARKQSRDAAAGLTTP